MNLLEKSEIGETLTNKQTNVENVVSSATAAGGAARGKAGKHKYTGFLLGLEKNYQPHKLYTPAF